MSGGSTVEEPDVPEVVAEQLTHRGRSQREQMRVESVRQVHAPSEVVARAVAGPEAQTGTDPVSGWAVLLAGGDGQERLRGLGEDSLLGGK